MHEIHPRKKGLCEIYTPKTVVREIHPRKKVVREIHTPKKVVR